MFEPLKRLLLGIPIASSEEHHQRLGRPTALTVFASDAISSTAYATEEILLVLVPVIGMVALNTLVPISIVVALLLAIVITSYRQTIYAYPSGGGSYVVSRENLGTLPSLIAGASLLVDYILTVAVSISAGVAAVTSAFEFLRPYRVEICLAALLVMMTANLRGTKESGKIFAPPVYTYVVSLALLIGFGLFEVFVRGLAPIPINTEALTAIAITTGPAGSPVFTGITVLLLLRAFSSGAVALTGVEAISNGVPAFKKPESHNAATTLIAMGFILGVAFMGLSVLAHNLQPTVSENETLLSTMARYLYEDGTSSIGSIGVVLYYILQFSTFAILILAANTAFADFPRVSSIIAADGYLPRQLSNRGDRLVFSNGILALTVVAGLLIVGFGGITSALIPLYAVGVFTGFTLSQAGMVVHHRTLREKGWRRNQVINAVGSVATLVVLVVVVVSKFTYGAWIPVALIPVIVVGFRAIHKHYTRVGKTLVVPDGYRSRTKRQTVVVLVGGVHRGVLDAITYARSMGPDRLMALCIVRDEAEEEHIKSQWDIHEIPITLRLKHSPYRDIDGPVLEFLDDLDSEWPDDLITVVVPEYLLSHWWEKMLHNQSAFLLRRKLRLRSNTVVTAVPVTLDEGEQVLY
ncbi:MAG: APC family permease [Actinomycetes bacterium]